MSVMKDGGRVVPESVLTGFGDYIGSCLSRGLRFQVAAGWVQHHRPEQAITVVRRRLEYARDEDTNTPEGFHFAERFGEPRGEW